MRRRWLVRVSLAWLWLVCLASLSACAKPTATTDGPVATCAKAGQQCQYAGGKIGLCTESSVAACDAGATCLVCMSLH